MLGWLKAKNENSRVWACVKDIKFVLENADPTRRAVILALANLQLWRIGTATDLTWDELRVLKVLDRPLDYGRDELMSVYRSLEEVRNRTIAEFEALQRSREIPEFSVKHAKNVQRSIEIWMCTLGAGIAPNRCEDVRLIWSYLVGSMSSLPVAIRELHSIERRTAEMTGTPDAQMFGDVTSEQWLEFCRYVPSSFAIASRQ